MTIGFMSNGLFKNITLWEYSVPGTKPQLYYEQRYGMSPSFIIKTNKKKNRGKNKNLHKKIKVYVGIPIQEKLNNNKIYSILC